MFQADGLFSLTLLYTVVAYLSAPVRSIEARPNDKEFEQSDGELE